MDCVPPLSEALRPWRKAQREALLARREAVDPEQRRAWSEAITAQLIEAFPEIAGKTIGFYWPIRGEFDPRFAIRHFREAGSRVALPVVVRKATPLEFREWWPGVATTPVPGAFGLPIPSGTEVLVPEVVLMPPVGFDAQCYRLGYGGGYFDRTLAAMAVPPLKIGVAFELQRLPTIQPQPHDIAMDAVITEAGVHRA